MPERGHARGRGLVEDLPSNDQWAPFPAEVGLSKPVIRLKNVVLPAPFGPISAVMMPRCTSRWSTFDRRHAAELTDDVVDHRGSESGFVEPGVGLDPRHQSGVGPPDRPRTGWSVCSDIELQLPLVAEDALWSEDHDQHQETPTTM